MTEALVCLYLDLPPSVCFYMFAVGLVLVCNPKARNNTSPSAAERFYAVHSCCCCCSEWKLWREKCVSFSGDKENTEPQLLIDESAIISVLTSRCSSNTDLWPQRIISQSHPEYFFINVLYLFIFFVSFSPSVRPPLPSCRRFMSWCVFALVHFAPRGSFFLQFLFSFGSDWI